MKNILVTGGLGFIGTSLVPKLQSLYGAEIRILDNLSNPSGDLQASDGIEIVESDVRDFSAVREAVRGVDAVVHLAAHTRVIDSIEDPHLNFDINTVGTFNVLEAMRQEGVPSLVNASTGGAILGEVPPPINEEIAAKPASPYGASKLAAEGYCWAYAQSYGLKAASLRFSNIYGPHSRQKSSVVAAFIKAIRDDGAVTVYGDGTQTRDYLFVEDLTDGILNAIQSGATGTYQLGFGKPTSVNTLIDIIRDITGAQYSVTYKPARVGEILHTYCDISKARTGIRYDPTTELAEGVIKTWDWFAASRDG
ncbi:MAG: NAD-dependent epimerase/dehydratase family protein [Methyloceanibacter sp.]|nr:NAD-dependent epimerase/dehydratase family protein [Methyloceanibacter sp.]